MKNKIQPTQQEIQLKPHDIIVSKTDLAGRITYANRAFMRIANFPERAILNVQHNVVRHPDMPRGAFKLLWDTLKAEREFFGYVKNMTADGHHYWVFANVTPDYNARGEVVGYFSVRRKPKPAAVQIMEGIYREMLDVERSAGVAGAPDASVRFLLDKVKNLGTQYDPFILSL